MYSVDNWRGFTLHKLPTVSLRWTVSLTFWEVNTICFFPLFLKMISSGLSWRVISYKLMIWKYGHMRWITFYLIGISLRLWVHMLNTIFNNNSVLAWWSVLLVEVVPENPRPTTNQWQPLLSHVHVSMDWNQTRNLPMQVMAFVGKG
jgi:hypothetical protein